MFFLSVSAFLVLLQLGCSESSPPSLNWPTQPQGSPTNSFSVSELVGNMTPVSFSEAIVAQVSVPGELYGELNVEGLWRTLNVNS